MSLIHKYGGERLQSKRHLHLFLIRDIGLEKRRLPAIGLVQL